jgi:DNA-directed RNA polymerase omega subunit
MKSAMNINNFLKVILATQRAKQIHKGARPLVQNSNARATRIALEEVERGLVSFEFIPQDLDLRSRRDNQGDSRQDGAGETNREVTNQLSVARLGD